MFFTIDRCSPSLILHNSQEIVESDIKTLARPRSATETSLVSTADTTDTNKDIESGFPENLVDTPLKDSTNKTSLKEEEGSNDELELDAVDEYMGDSKTQITIPFAGETYLRSGYSNATRDVPNGCAICLSAFDLEDRIVWSSNAGCNHVFHHDCILDWFMASGRKALKRQRREEARTGVVQFTDDPVQKIASCPMLCPCCRQDFVSPFNSEESDSETGKKEPNGSSNNTQATTAGSNDSADEVLPVGAFAAVVTVVGVPGDDAV